MLIRQPSSSHLHPCPVCGNSEFGFHIRDDEDGFTASVTCDGCNEDLATVGSASAPRDTVAVAKAEAIQLWNEFAIRSRS